MTGASDGTQSRDSRLHTEPGSTGPTREGQAAAGVPAGPATVPLASVPRQLPATLRHFAGRKGELAVLDERLDQLSVSVSGAGGGVVISAIGGMAGVGKTTLALHWAHRVAGQFPDGQLYANLGGHGPSGQPADAAEVLRRFLDALGVPTPRIPADLDSQAGLYRSLLAGRRILIVADNARDAEQVRVLLPGAPGCLVLVTSRSQLTGLAATEGAALLKLDVLTATEAAAMLSARIGADRVAAEPAAVTELIRLCGRLPLALAIIAARAATSGWPLADVAAELADACGRLDALDLGDPQTGVQAVFSWSYQQLNGPAARLFGLLSVHPGPDISIAAAASLASLPLPQAQTALRELTDASLVQERVPGRFTLHDLLRIYAAQCAGDGDTGKDRQDAAVRMLDHYLHSAAAASGLLDPARQARAQGALGAPADGVTPEVIADSEHALAWFTAEHKVLLAVTGQAAAEGFESHPRWLAWGLVTYFGRGGHWHDLIATQQTALDCAERGGDLAGQASAHRELSRAYLRQGEARPALAHVMRAVELSRRLGDQSGEALANLTLSVVYQRTGQPEESLAASLRALDLAEAADDTLLRANACNNAGYQYAVLGDCQQALIYCRRALDLHQQLDSPPLEASTWDSLGYVYRQLGDYHQATQCYQRAISLFGEHGDRFARARAFNHLGDTQLAGGDGQAARKAWQRAATILDDLDHPDADQVRSKLRDASIAPAPSPW